MENKPSLLKLAVGKTVSGFLLGIGFTLAMTLVGSIAAGYFEKSIEQEFTSKYKDFTPESGLKIFKHSDQSTPDKLIIIGALKNTSETSWESIQIEVETFKEGEFVRECTEYLSGSVGPGETENFQVDCGGCNNYSLPAYDSYTIEVISAH